MRRVIPCALLALVALLLWCGGGSRAWAATITSTASGGNASAGGSWVGGVAPVDGDIIIVASGATINQDVNRIYGSKAAGVGYAIQINGTSAVTFGQLNVNAGVSLTLRGFDRGANLCGWIRQWGRFVPAPGSTVLLDVATDGSSYLQNDGICTFTGTVGSHITLSSPAANQTWNTAVAFDTGSLTFAYYDSSAKVGCYTLNNVGVANAANTGLGSMGDTSLSFASQSPAGILATEVASVALCNGTGKYYVDYTAGLVYWYQASGTTFRFIANYKRLDYPGSAIQSFANTDGNQITVTYTDCSYVGDLGAGPPYNEYLFYCKNKFSASGTLRDCQITHNTFTFVKRAIGLDNVNGTIAAPIKIEDNSFQGYIGDDYGVVLGLFSSSTAYVSFQRNQGKGLQRPTTWCYVIFGFQGATLQTHSHWTIADNWFLTDGFLSGGSQDQTVWPDCTMSGCVTGLGGNFDTRVVSNFAGTAGHPATISNLMIWRGHRLINFGSHGVIANSVFGYQDHHTISGPASLSDVLSTDIVVNNNLSLGMGGGGFVELGYAQRQFVDVANIHHNTIHASVAGTAGAASGALTFGDGYDTVGPELMANVTLSSNLVSSPVNGVYRSADIAGRTMRIHLTAADYNDVFGATGAAYTNFSRFSTWSGLVNVAGVSLFNPSYSSPISGKTLALTVTSATNQTLAWDGGTAVQLVQDSGTATGGSNNASGFAVNWSGVLNDTGKTWSTDQSTTTTPIGRWVKITGGTGVGQIARITNCTATSLTVVPAWTTPPDATSTYSLYKSEITLTAGDANTVSAGIDLRVLPTATTSDTGVAMALHSIATDPQYVDATRTPATWDTSLGGAGTEEGAWTRLRADPTLARTALLPYIRAGFAPTNAAIKTADQTGTGVPGAVAGKFSVLLRRSPDHPRAGTRSALLESIIDPLGGLVCAQ